MKPILFSTPMVRAILNTKPGAWPAEPADPEKPFKWQTRRTVKPRYRDGEAGFEVARGLPGTSVNIIDEDGQFTREMEPPYWPGDILWVRESFAKTSEGEYLYRADPMFDHCGKGDFGWNWSPSRYMPRVATRLFLEVKDARVERLQGISEADVRAEGIAAPLLPTCADPALKIRLAFAELWNGLNAKRGYGWAENPYVYVYEFTRLDPEEAQAKEAK
jgi:hypothetical protein